MGYIYQELLYLLLMQSGSEVARSDTLAPFHATSFPILSSSSHTSSVIISWNQGERTYKKGVFAFLLIDAQSTAPT